MSDPLKALHDLAGKTAVVTGAGRGIGAATARLFAQAGAAVALLDRSAEHAESVAGEIGKGGGTSFAIACDVTDERAVERAFATVVERTGRVDILVNNAGSAIREPALSVALEDWRRIVELNLTALFSCSRTAARTMNANGGGAIVNLASIMGFSGGIYPNASYQASKGGVVNLTRALALEWAADNIRVNAVAPTWVRTDLTTTIFENEEKLARVMAHTPLGRLPEVEDIAAAILFLAGPAARCVTGVILPVDSGYLAC